MTSEKFVEKGNKKLLDAELCLLKYAGLDSLCRKGSAENFVEIVEVVKTLGFPKNGFFHFDKKVTINPVYG